MLEIRQVVGGSPETSFTPVSMAHFRVRSRLCSATHRILGSPPPPGTPAAPPKDGSHPGIIPRDFSGLSAAGRTGLMTCLDPWACPRRGHHSMTLPCVSGGPVSELLPPCITPEPWWFRLSHQAAGKTESSLAEAPDPKRGLAKPPLPGKRHPPRGKF